MHLFSKKKGLVPAVDNKNAHCLEYQGESAVSASREHRRLANITRPEEVIEFKPSNPSLEQQGMHPRSAEHAIFASSPVRLSVKHPIL